MTYDSSSDLTSITDADNNTTQYSYSSAGNLLSITYPDGTQQSFSYDPLGNMTETIEQNGDPVGYQYNAQGLVTQETFADGTPQTFAYDAHGNLITAETFSSSGTLTGTTTLTYNAANELTSVSYPGDLSLLLHLQRPGPAHPERGSKWLHGQLHLRCAGPALGTDRRLGQPDRPVHLQQPRRAGGEAERQRHLHNLRLRRQRQPDERGQLRGSGNDDQFFVHLHVQCARRADVDDRRRRQHDDLRLRRHRPVDAGDAARRPDHHLRL